MARLTHVEVGTFDPRRFDDVLPPERHVAFTGALERARADLGDRPVWNVNSTPRGGGVAEMLRSLLAYARGGGIDARWVVIEGSPEFFRVTKRLHNRLHGHPGDGGPLGRAEQETYSRVLEDNAHQLRRLLRPGDVVMLHDPQTAGLVDACREVAGAVVWRCHIGVDAPDDLVRGAWDFLRPHLEHADAYVFSRKEYVWEGLDPGRTVVVPPSIDAFSPKNQELAEPTVAAILSVAGLVSGRPPAAPLFVRFDGRPAAVHRRAGLVDGHPPPPPDAPLVTQVSRWDRLKDPAGVLEGFARVVAGRQPRAHLVLAGPEVEAVADDPEGAEVLSEVRDLAARLPSGVRERVHLAALPMADGEENAAIVNALQRHSAVVVQKSLAEGFGLTVAEAMWKARPVVASRVGGIQDQIVDGVSGVLVDPRDLEAFGEAVSGLLADPARAAAMGERARLRVRDEFLAARQLMQYLELFTRLLRTGP